MKRTIIAFAILCTIGQAYAQQNTPERKGFMIGASAGIGILSMSGNTTGVSEGTDISLPNLKLGWMLNNDLALLLTQPGASYEENGDDRSIDGVIPSVQYWAKPNWWISGGFGLGWDAPAFYEDSKNNHFGTACQFSTGYEFYRKGRFTMDIQGTLFAAKVDTDNGSREAVSFLTGIGFNFY